jgi:hypothetical protein
MLSSIPFNIGLLRAELTDGKKATNAHVLVFGAVTIHDIGEKGCIASNDKLAKETGYSKQRVADVLSEMNAAGWLRVEMKDGKRIRIVPLLEIGKPQEGGFLPVRRGVLASKNIDNNIDNTPTEGTTAKAGDNSPNQAQEQPPKDDVKRLFYMVVKKYQLSVLNHNHVSGWCTKLKATLGEPRAKTYLKYLLVRDLNMERKTNEFVPTLNRPLDIVDKAAKIIRYYKDNQAAPAAPDMQAIQERERRREEEAERIRNGEAI